MWKTVAAFAALMLIAVPAQAQRSPTFQSGRVNPGDAAKMQGNSTVTGAGDILGDANGKGVNPFSIQDRGGPGLCLRTDASGNAHNSFCLEHSADGTAVLSIDALGGAPVRGLKCRINGVETDCPGTPESGAIPVTMLGVKPGSTDNSAAMQAIIDGGKYSHVYFPPSDQPYRMQNIVISKKIRIDGKPGATVMYDHAAAGVVPIFQFNPGSDGSVLDGFTCDGNRDVLGAYFDAGGGGGTQWPCFRTEGTAIKAHLRLKNFVSRAFMLSNCTPGMDIDVLVEDSGTTINSYNCADGKINIIARRIGNDGISEFAHPATLFGTKRMRIDYTLDDWNPDTANRDPIPVGFAAHEDGPGNDYMISVSGFHGTDINGQPACRGVVINGGIGSDYNLTSTGCVQNIRMNGVTDSHIKCFADGNYIVATGYENMPVRISYGAWQQTNVANSTWDTNGLSPSARVSMDCIGIRGKFNFIGAVQDSHVQMVAEGNTSFGIMAGCELTSTPFPGQPGQCPTGLVLKAISRYNGNSGIGLTGFGGITIDAGSDVSNNGQPVPGSLGGVWRSGIIVNDTDAGFPTNNVTVSGTLIARDTQSFTIVGGASFAPGASDTDNQYQITLINPQRVNGIGQYITLANAGGPGTDITGKIVAISNQFQQTVAGGITSYGYPTDVITLETAAPVTYAESGNTTALTGTASSDGLTVTIAGGAAATELKGHTWITDGTEWRRVERVNSDTQIAINTPFSANLSGVTLSKLAVDIVGIPSQSYGMALPVAALTGKFRFGAIDASGVINSTFYANGQASLIEFDNSIYARGVSGTTNLSDGATLYVGPGVASTDSTQVGQAVGRAGIVKKFTCYASIAPAAGKTITCTLGQGGNDTPSTCVILSGQNSCSIDTANPPLTADYKIYAKFVADAGITATPVSWATEIVPGFTN